MALFQHAQYSITWCDPYTCLSLHQNKRQNITFDPYLWVHSWSPCCLPPPDTTKWRDTWVACSGEWSATPSTEKEGVVIHDIHVYKVQVHINKCRWKDNQLSDSFYNEYFVKDPICPANIYAWKKKSTRKWPICQLDIVCKFKAIFLLYRVAFLNCTLVCSIPVVF